MKTVNAKEYSIRKQYSEAILNAIDDATDLEVAFGSGAEGIFAWANSMDGKCAMDLAGYEFNDGTPQMLRNCVIESARTKRHLFDGRQAA